MAKSWLMSAKVLNSRGIVGRVEKKPGCQFADLAIEPNRRPSTGLVVSLVAVGRRLQLRDDLMTEEVEVDPLRGAAAFGTAKNFFP